MIILRNRYFSEKQNGGLYHRWTTFQAKMSPKSYNKANIELYQNGNPTKLSLMNAGLGGIAGGIAGGLMASRLTRDPKLIAKTVGAVGALSAAGSGLGTLIAGLGVRGLKKSSNKMNNFYNRGADDIKIGNGDMSVEEYNQKYPGK